LQTIDFSDAPKEFEITGDLVIDPRTPLQDFELNLGKLTAVENLSVRLDARLSRFEAPSLQSVSRVLKLQKFTADAEVPMIFPLLTNIGRLLIPYQCPTISELRFPNLKKINTIFIENSDMNVVGIIFGLFEKDAAFYPRSFYEVEGFYDGLRIINMHPTK